MCEVWEHCERDVARFRAPFLFSYCCLARQAGSFCCSLMLRIPPKWIFFITFHTLHHFHQHYVKFLHYVGPCGNRQKRYQLVVESERLASPPIIKILIHLAKVIYTSNNFYARYAPTPPRFVPFRPAANSGRAQMAKRGKRRSWKKSAHRTTRCAAKEKSILRASGYRVNTIPTVKTSYKEKLLSSTQWIPLFSFVVLPPRSSNGGKIAYFRGKLLRPSSLLSLRSNFFSLSQLATRAVFSHLLSSITRSVQHTRPHPRTFLLTPTFPSF